VNLQSCVIVVFLHLFIFLPFSGLVPFYPSLLPLIQFIVAGRHTPTKR
jgi:hypothetical protein